MSTFQKMWLVLPRSISIFSLAQRSLQGSSLRCFCSCSQLITSNRSPYLNSQTHVGLHRSLRSLHISQAVNKKKEEETFAGPYKFTTSSANSESMPKSKDIPEYQTYIVLASSLVFLIYWCMLREENDLDEEMNMQLFTRVPAIEEPHLKIAIPRMKRAGVDTTEAELRLQQLVKERKLEEARMNK